MRSLATQTPTRVNFRNKNPSGTSEITVQSTISTRTPKTGPTKRHLIDSEPIQYNSVSSINTTPRSTRSLSKERTRKPPSATTRNQDNQNEGFFYEKLQQREENLAKEKRKLELAKEKLLADFEQLERQRRSLQEEENEISGFNQQMMKDQSQLGQQSLYLKKMASDLKKQIEIAEAELEGMKQGGRDAKTLKEIANQQIRVDKLHELMDLMQNEILTRENEVIQMELAVVERKKTIEKNEKFKKELEERKIKALNKKKQLMELTSIRSQNIQRMESSYIDAKKRLDNAQAERERLKQLSQQYDQEEEDIKNKLEILNQRKLQLEENRQSRIKLHKEVKEELEIREKLLAEHPIDPSFDLSAFQMEVEKDEKDLQDAILQFETRNNQVVSSLQTRKDKLLDDINALKNELSNNKSLVDLQKELEIAQIQYTESKKTMDDKNRELDDLKSQILSDAEFNQKNEDYKNELKRIQNLEKDLKSLEKKIQEDEDQIEADEETAKQARSEIESEKKMFQLKEDASNKMITIYKNQYEQATERYQTLVQQRDKTKNLNDINHQSS